MSRYNKLWAGIGGYVVGALFGYLAWAGLATCTDPLVLDTCSMWGIDKTLLTNILGGLVGAISIERSAANTQ